MCGIFGYTGFKKEELDNARKALNALSHRGPDQWGDWYDDGMYIGHRRLSVIDLSENGIQPMKTDDVVIAVNGEIYNFIELRSELKKKYGFNSQSDSEVVLHGYSEWGIEALLKRIDGMYAFCIYDKKSKKLFLARDRFGKKPLYYTVREGKFFFSSEIKAFFELDDCFRVFSYQGIKDWLYHRGSHSSRTIFHNIHKLEPGCYLEVNENKATKIKYYDVMDHIDAGNVKAGFDINTLEDYINRSVKRRIISDVPVGLQLSGGVDSSLIAHYLNKNHAGVRHTFSVGFKGSEYAEYSEETYARFVAEKMGLTHHQLNITMEDVVHSFEKTVYLFDGMLDYPNAIPMHMLCVYAKEYVTVVLTGEGADELFGGYTKFKKMDSLSDLDRLASLCPDIVIDGIGKTGLRAIGRSIYLKKKYSGRTKQILEDLNCYITPETFSMIFGPSESSLFDDIPYSRLSDFPFFKQLLIMDHKTYLFSLLDRQDRASMGAAIESRLPFLDKELVEYVFCLSKDNFFDSEQNKKILKKLSEKIYGAEFTHRPKKGFPLPLQDWLHNARGFQPYIDAIFSDDFLLHDGIDMDYLKRRLNTAGFDNKLLNYGDSESIWITWFLMVIRAAQDIFNIKHIE